MTDQAGQLLRGIRVEGIINEHRRGLLRELAADLRRVDRQLADIDSRIHQAVVASGTTLTDIVGVGPILAAVILGHVGDVGRFPSRGHFASYHGTGLGVDAPPTPSPPPPDRAFTCPPPRADLPAVARRAYQRAGMQL